MFYFAELVHRIAKRLKYQYHEFDARLKSTLKKYFYIQKLANAYKAILLPCLGFSPY